MEKWIDEYSRVVLTGSYETIKIWDLNGKKCIQKIHLHADKWVTSILVLNSSVAVSGDSSGTIMFWEIHSGKLLRKIDAHEEMINSIIHVKNGETIASCGDENIKIWDILSFKCIRKLKRHRKNVNSIFYLVERNILVSGSNDNKIIVWFLNWINPKKDEQKVLSGHTEGVTCLCQLSEDRFVSGSLDWFLRIWDLEIGCIYKIKLSGAVRSVIFIKNEYKIFCSSYKTIKKFDLFDETIDSKTIKLELIESKEAHDGQIYALQKFSATSFISCSDDSTVKKWKVNGNLIPTTLNESDEIWSLSSFKSNKFVSKIEKIQRVKYLYNHKKDLYDVELKFKNKSLSCFKSMLLLSNIHVVLEKKIKMGMGNIVDIPYNLYLAEKEAFMILLGEEPEIKGEESIFNIFHFFQSLRIREGMFVVCKSISRIKDLFIIVKLLLKSVDYYKEKKYESFQKTLKFEEKEIIQVEKIEFNSVLTLACVNILVKNIKEIRQEEDLLFSLDSVGYYNLVKFFEKKSILSHRDFVTFNSLVNKEVNTFYDVFMKNLKVLFRRKDYSNLVLISSMESKIKKKGFFKKKLKYFCNKEINLIRSNFFFLMDKFTSQKNLNKDEKKTKDSEEIVIESLSTIDLHYLLEFIYTYQVSTDNLEVLRNLLSHADCYFESDLKFYLIEKMKRIFIKYHEKDLLLVRLVQHSKLILSLSEDVQNEFFGFFSLKFKLKKKSLLNLFGYFDQTNGK